MVTTARCRAPEHVLGRGGPHRLDLFKHVIEINLTGTSNAIRLAVQAVEKMRPTPAANAA